MGETVAIEGEVGRAGEEARRMRVLDAAERVFLAYGFQRTTMDDIAKAAEISRPALYLHFRNKTDIYRAGTRRRLDEAADMAESRLAGAGPFEPKLATAIADSVLALVERFCDTPHGEELLDLKNALAADLHAAWRARMIAAISKAIAAETAASGVDLAGRGLKAEGVAAIFLAGLEGMKAQGADDAARTEGFLQLTRMVGLAIAP